MSDTTDDMEALCGEWEAHMEENLGGKKLEDLPKEAAIKEAVRLQKEMYHLKIGAMILIDMLETEYPDFGTRERWDIAINHLKKGLNK